MNATDILFEWPEENIAVRLERCRVMLRTHGFLSAAESDRCRYRMNKWLAREHARSAQPVSARGQEE